MFPLPSVIQCVWQRREYARELQDRLNGVLYMDRGGNPVKAFCASLMTHGGRAHLHLHDDVILSKFFESKVLEPIATYGHELIAFFPGKSNMSPGKPVMRKAGLRYTQCMWIPDWFPENYLNWALENDFNPNPANRWSEISQSVDCFLQSIGRKYISWYPVLVQQRACESIIHKTVRQDQSPFFLDTFDKAKALKNEIGLTIAE